MTILKSPPQHGDGHAATRWYQSGHPDETTGDTDVWEHETFGEEQARLERGDPEYAQIGEAVPQAKEKGLQASLSADKPNARWDPRGACQRAADASTPTEPSDDPPRDQRSRSSQLHANFAIASHDPPAAKIIPEPVRTHESTGRRPRDETVFFHWPDEPR
jgi:hypothetical protein